MSSEICEKNLKPKRFNGELVNRAGMKTNARVGHEHILNP